MLRNYDFGKYVSESDIDYAPLNVCINDVWYCPADDSVLKSLNYKNVILTRKPDDGKLYEPYWYETTKSIKQKWRECVIPPLTPSELREHAYETEEICPYGDGFYTVDYMNDLWYKYSAEGNTEKAGAIQEIIATAKEYIREEYPDE